MPQKTFFRRQWSKNRIPRTSLLLRFGPSSKGSKTETGFNLGTTTENFTKNKASNQGKHPAMSELSEELGKSTSRQATCLIADRCHKEVRKFGASTRNLEK